MKAVTCFLVVIFVVDRIMSQTNESVGKWIHYDAQSRIFHLRTKLSSYAFQIHTELNIPVHLYWGSALAVGDSLEYLGSDYQPVSFDAGLKNSLLLEYSDFGTGDYRSPAFATSKPSAVSPLVYDFHLIFSNSTGSPESGRDFEIPADSPHFRLHSDESESESLVVRLVDQLSGLCVDLVYSVFPEQDSIARHTEFSISEGFKDTNEIQLERAASFMVDFPQSSRDSGYLVSSLWGGWARERHIQTHQLHPGTVTFDSRRGSSSHQHSPFVMVSSPHSKGYFSFGLVYSSSWQISIEMSQDRSLRVAGGLHPDTFSWRLTNTGDDVFRTPESILTFAESSDSISNKLHSLIRERLLPSRERTQWDSRSSRPVLVNSWEAMYFDCTKEKIIRDLVRPAHQLGIDMVVVDDGWFSSRDNDSSSLGDWYVNYDKFPGGLGTLADEMQRDYDGMKLGIWMEPEMVSPDSNLFREYPEWVLGVDGREKTQSRNQYVLDLSRTEVQDFIVETVTRVLKESRAEYLKWDFNRFLTEVHNPQVSDGEIYHRWVMGLYSIWHRLTMAHPHVLFESCSGGGGRYDLGLMYFTPQIWTSDNTDALARVPIQMGSTLFYAPNTMGSHVSAVPNHQLHRSTGMMTRHVVAMSGILGYELNLRTIGDEDVSVIKKLVEMYKKRIQSLVLEGTFYRLSNDPMTASVSARDENAPEVSSWMYVSPDGKSAAVFGILTSYYELIVRPERIRMKGLKEDEIYTVEIYQQEWSEVSQMSNMKLSGSALMNAGIPVKWRADADSVLMMLEMAQ